MDKVLIADMGVEGGGVTIYGRKVDGAWSFWQEGTSIGLEENDDEVWPGWSLEPVSELPQALPDKWWLMYPTAVHPEFVAQIRREYDRCVGVGGEIERRFQHGRWEEVLSPGGPDANSIFSPHKEWTANEDTMTIAVAEKISFVELASRVLEKTGKPMTASEIWQYAEETGIATLLQSTGKTPEASLGARLYTDVQKPTSAFVKLGSRPAKFLLKSLAGSIPDLQQQVAAQPLPLAVQKTYGERELHPLLVWFADGNFGAHCRTIFHEKSLKRGEKQNQWIHPDVVGFSLTTQDWTHEVVQLVQTSGALAARLYSFEMKISLDFPTLREYFFQAVSNSSWAHEGYLVAVDIDDDPDFRAELTRLSQSFGIGVIQLNTSEPVDSTVLLAARERSEIDWKTVDRIAALNPDFKEFVNSVAKSIKINQPAVTRFDKLLDDSELDVHLKRMLGK